jgi:hypothetical protein
MTTRGEKQQQIGLELRIGEKKKWGFKWWWFLCRVTSSEDMDMGLEHLHPKIVSNSFTLK